MLYEIAQEVVGVFSDRLVARVAGIGDSHEPPQSIVGHASDSGLLIGFTYTSSTGMNSMPCHLFSRAIAIYPARKKDFPSGSSAVSEPFVGQLKIHLRIQSRPSQRKCAACVVRVPGVPAYWTVGLPVASVLHKLFGNCRSCNF